jgi:thioredoxin 1
MKKIRLYLLIGVAISLWTTAIVSGDTADSSNETTIPTPGMVTMVDLGADKCIPCKMMAPIIEELKGECDGVAAIHFIDVWKNPAEAKKYGISAIPTQIFYDKEGNEMERHTGFLDKKSILEIFAKLGAQMDTVQE